MPLSVLDRYVLYFSCWGLFLLPELKLILSSIVVATEDCFVLSDYDTCNSISIPRDGIPLFII